MPAEGRSGRARAHGHMCAHRSSKRRGGEPDPPKKRKRAGNAPLWGISGEQGFSGGGISGPAKPKASAKRSSEERDAGSKEKQGVGPKARSFPLFGLAFQDDEQNLVYFPMIGINFT